MTKRFLVQIEALLLKLKAWDKGLYVEWKGFKYPIVNGRLPLTLRELNLMVPDATPLLTYKLEDSKWRFIDYEIDILTEKLELIYLKKVRKDFTQKFIKGKTI